MLAKAREAGSRRLEGRALNALAAVALSRDGNPEESERLASAAHEVVPADDISARFETLARLAAAAWWPGDLRRAEGYIREAAALAESADRHDLWSRAMGNLVWLLELRLDLPGAEAILTQLEPPGEGVLERARASRALGALRRMQGRLAEAAEAFADAQALYLDAGVAGEAAWLGVLCGWVAFVDGDLEHAERSFRHAVRVFTANEDYGHLCEAQRALAEVLLETGHVDEAERYALAAARSSAATTSPRRRRRHARLASFARRRATMSKPRRCCASRCRSSRAQTSGCSRSRRSSRSFASSACAIAATRRSSSRRAYPMRFRAGSASPMRRCSRALGLRTPVRARDPRRRGDGPRTARLGPARHGDASARSRARARRGRRSLRRPAACARDRGHAGRPTRTDTSSPQAPRCRRGSGRRHDRPAESQGGAASGRVAPRTSRRSSRRQGRELELRSSSWARWRP